MSEQSNVGIELGEPQEEVWLGGICIERYPNAVRLVQPLDRQLKPESVVIPDTASVDIAEYIEAWGPR